MPSRTRDNKIGAEDGRATRRTQRRDTNRAGAWSGGRGACGPSSGLRVGLQRGGRQSTRRIVNEGVAEGEESAVAAAPRRDSQSTPKGVRVVRRDMGGIGCAACSKRPESDYRRIKAFLHQRRKCTGRVGNGRVAEGKEVVETARPRRASERTPEGTRAVRRTSTEK